MSKLLANEIANYGDDAPIDLKEGLNIPAGKPIQAAGVSGSSGMVLTSTGSSISWTIPFDGNYNSLTNRPTIPAAQVNSDWNATSGVSVILNKPTVPPLTSLTVNPAGTPALSFNAANGEFTYTPPDLSNYDTAFGWGDHAQAGYLTAEVDTIQDVVQRSYYDRPWFGGTFSNSWAPGGYPVFNTTTFTNEIYHHGFGDSIHIGSNTAGVRWLDYDFTGDGPSDAGKNSGKIIGYNYYIANETVDSFRGGGTVANGINQLANVLHHDVQPDVDGNVTTYSIGNDAGIIRLGNRSGLSPYLEASSTATKLFHNGSEKLTTTTTGIDLGSSELVTTGKLVYSNNYANVADLPSATTYHGMFAHVHAEGHGYMSHGGVWLQLIDETSSVDELSDVNTAAKQDGYVLKWDAATSNWKPAPDLVGTSNAGITLQDLSVQTGTASSTPSLSYSNTTGVFTYTPPDLSSFLTSYTETDPVFSASAASGILSSNIANWDSAYGWGDHASAGYLTAEVDNLSSVTGRNQLTLTLGGGYGTKNCGSTSNHILFGGLVIYENDIMNIGVNDRTLFGHRNGAITWCGDDGSNETDWQNRKFELYHLDSSQSTSQWHALAGALYLKSDDGYPISIGNDTGDIQLGNKSGSVKYLTASSTATKLFLNGAEKLSTTASGVTITGSLTAGGLTYPTSNGTSGDVLTSDGAGNVTWQAPTGGGGGGANVTISDTIPPGTPNVGDLWWESDSGRLKVYYQDVDSAQWVDASPPLAQGGGGGGSSTSIISPVAYAVVSANTAGTGTGMSWGAYNTGTYQMVFTFDTAQPDTNYYVHTNREQFATHNIEILSKTTTGFTTKWTNSDGSDLAPSIFKGVLIVYASTPTKTVGSGGGIALADLSVQSATASGGGSLAYNNVTGVFTHTPPDLSNSTNWDTAYGWGDHASAGYLTSANTTFTGLTDTPGSYTAGAFIATNEFGNALISSNLYQDSGGEIGIGTNNPNSLLHLYQSSDAVYMTFESSSTIPYWIGIPGGAVGNGGFWIERGDNNHYLFTADSSDYVSLYGAGTKRLETTSTGVTVTGSITAGGLTYPTVNGTNGDVLTSDGTGGVAWQTPSAGGSGSLQLVTSAVLPSDVVEVRYDSNLLQQDTIYRMVGILEVTGNAYGGFNMNPSFYDTSTNTQYGQAFSGQQNTQYSSPANHESICGPFTPVPTTNQFGLQNAVWYDEQGSLSWWLRTDQQNNIPITGMYFEATFSTYLGPWMHMTFGSMNNRYHTGTFTGGWDLNPLSTYINNMEYSFVGGGQQIKAGSKIWLYKYV